MHDFPKSVPHSASPHCLYSCCSDFVDSPTLRLEATNTAYEPSPNEKRGGRSGDQIETESYDEDFGNDDGLAPLGGKWPAPSSSLDSENSRMVTSEMLSDPERHLRSIHICAVHYLKVRIAT